MRRPRPKRPTKKATRKKYLGRPRLSPDEIWQLIRGAALTGYGGAHFPVHRKWESVRQPGPVGLVVANGAESEPLSAKDIALLQLRPHLVLDGLELTALALGAQAAVIWLHESARSTRDSVDAALRDRTGSLQMTVRTAPSGYLSGESSAVVRAVSGGPAIPSFRPVRGRSLDRHGAPVLVHNVETLARIALAARGIRPTNRLFTVSHRGLRTVVEIAGAAPVNAALDAAEFGAPFEAILVGGYGGRWFSAAAAGQLGSAAAPGAGVLFPIESGDCGLRCVAAITEFMAEAGARQCGPCRFGLPAIAELLGHVVDTGGQFERVEELRRTLSLVAGRGACGHPDGVTGMVSSALQVFAGDLESHLDSGRCRRVG